MVKKTKTPRKAAPRAAAPKKVYRRRAKSGVQYIPAAMATVGLVAANADNIKHVMNNIQTNGLTKSAKYYLTNSKGYGRFIGADQLVKDAMYYAGGYVAGEIAKKYAPAVIKTPMGKLAKKIPRL